MLLFIGITGSVTSQSYVIIGDCVLWRNRSVIMAVNT